MAIEATPRAGRRRWALILDKFLDLSLPNCSSFELPGRSSCPAAAAAAPDPGPVDLNRAGVEELARLPGVGPGLARRIVEERERRGRFDSPDALRNILGLGPKKLAAMRHLVTVND